jgi:hypothetical protein
MDVVKFLNDLTNFHLLAWKSALASLVLALAGLQVVAAARLWQSSAPGASRLHRWNGRVVLVLTVVLGYACLFATAGPTSPSRVLLHSIFGTTLFALLAVKFSALRLNRPSETQLPLLGSLLFGNYLAVWVLSAFDYITSSKTDPDPSTQLQVWVAAGGLVGVALGVAGMVAFVRSRTPGLSTAEG